MVVLLLGSSVFLPEKNAPIIIKNFCGKQLFFLISSKYAIWYGGGYHSADKGSIRINPFMGMPVQL
jgi:hypothetical protein